MKHKSGNVTFCAPPITGKHKLWAVFAQSSQEASDYIHRSHLQDQVLLGCPSGAMLAVLFASCFFLGAPTLFDPKVRF